MQKLFAQAVMRPLSSRWRMQTTWTNGRPTKQIIQSLIVSTPTLSAAKRVEIYNRQYWFRLIDCFYEDFPGLRSILGTRRFNQLMFAYLKAHPSKSYTLRHLGQFLPAFINHHPSLTHPRRQLAYDMAQLEWAQIQAFESASLPPVNPQSLATITPNRLRLRLQPHLQLLTLTYPLDQYLHDIKLHAALREQSSNAADNQQPAARLKKMTLPHPEKIHLAVHRFNHKLYYKRITAAELALLKYLQEKLTLQTACHRLLQHPRHRRLDLPHLLPAWFSAWAELGWLSLR